MNTAAPWLLQRLASQEIESRGERIRSVMLAESAHLREPNFTAIAAHDLEKLYSLYDGLFFAGELNRELLRQAERGLIFRVSPTMTSSGGSTVRFRRRQPDGAHQEHYEIRVSSRLLFNSFNGEQRPIVIGGLQCGDRLAALQRIMEHEILHLAEMLVWRRSSCSRDRYKSLARNLFGHTATHHQLITPREHAATEFSIHLGSLVEFEFEGRKRIGRINRINRRATVLVEDSNGQRYSDGKHYMKYYVPLQMLKRN